MTFRALSMILFVLVFTGLPSSAETITIDLSEGRPTFIPEWLLSCQKAGAAKLVSQAKSFGISVDMKSLRMTGESANLFASYIWWAVNVTDTGGRADLYPPGKPLVLQLMTQKPSGRDCF